MAQDGVSETPASRPARGVGGFLVKAAGIVAILMLAVLAGLWAVEHYIERRLAPDPETIASASLQGLREQNRLSAFEARFVAVVTSKQTRLGLSAADLLFDTPQFLDRLLSAVEQQPPCVGQPERTGRPRQQGGPQMRFQRRNGAGRRRRRDPQVASRRREASEGRDREKCFDRPQSIHDYFSDRNNSLHGQPIIGAAGNT